MKIVNKFRKFQEGGAMPPQEAAPSAAPEGAAQDPMMQIIQVADQALQTQNCEAAMAVCQALLQLAGAAGGGEEAPAQEPTYARYGAKLVRVK